MTNTEIKKDILGRISRLGEKEAFKEIAVQNVKCVLPSFVNMPKSIQKAYGISNLAMSMSIDAYRCTGLINKLYSSVLYNKMENVICDEINDYVVSETMKLLSK